MHTNYVNNNGVKRSAFGEQLVTTGTPTIQFDAVYGLRQKTDIDITADVGSVGGVTLQSNSNGTKEFKITSGAQANTYGHLRSISE